MSCVVKVGRLGQHDAQVVENGGAMSIENLASRLDVRCFDQMDYNGIPRCPHEAETAVRGETDRTIDRCAVHALPIRWQRTFVDLAQLGCKAPCLVQQSTDLVGEWRDRRPRR